MGAGKQGGREAFKNKQTSDSVSAQEPGSEAEGTPIQAVITPFSTPRVARPQPTRQPHSQTRDRSWLKLGRPRGISASSPYTRDPRGEQGGRAGSPDWPGQRWPALLLPPRHPGRTRSASPTRSKRPKMHQPITSSAAAAAIFASGPDKPKGQERGGKGPGEEGPGTARPKG